MNVTVLITQRDSTTNLEIHVSRQSAERALIRAALTGLEDIQQTQGSAQLVSEAIFLLKNGTHAARLTIALATLSASGIEHSILSKQVRNLK